MDATTCSARCLGMSRTPRKMVRTVNANSGSRGMTSPCNAMVISAKTDRLPKVVIRQSNFVESQAWTRQNAIQRKCAAQRAKNGVCRKRNVMCDGEEENDQREVSGSPTIQPLTAGPQRRPARLAVPIIRGARISFRVRIFMG